MDRFTLEAVDLGKLYKVKIRHDNAMFNPAWFLDRVEITDSSTQHKDIFHCERWLAKNKDDGKIERSLYVKVRSMSRLGQAKLILLDVLFFPCCYRHILTSL